MRARIAVSWGSPPSTVTVARRRAHHAQQHLDEGRLAGAVGADEPEGRARRNGEGQPAQRVLLRPEEPLVRLDQLAHREGRRHGRGDSTRGPRGGLRRFRSCLPLPREGRGSGRGAPRGTAGDPGEDESGAMRTFLQVADRRAPPSPQPSPPRGERESGAEQHHFTARHAQPIARPQQRRRPRGPAVDGQPALPFDLDAPAIFRESERQGGR